jgi:hypothetical protein
LRPSSLLAPTIAVRAVDVDALVRDTALSSVIADKAADERTRQTTRDRGVAA